MGIRDYIVRLTSRKPTPVVEVARPLALDTEEKSFSVDVTEIRSTGLPSMSGLYEDFELLYRRDGVIFGIVNKFARDVSATQIVIDAKDETVKKELEEWMNRSTISFREVIKNIIVDNLVWGNAFYELKTNASLDDIVRLVRKNPKYMDFERDMNGNVILDEQGKPVKVVEVRSGKKTYYPKYLVAHFALFRLPDEPIGISPLESLYNIIKYKLNVEKASSQGFWRQGFPPIIATVGTDNQPATPEMMKDVKKAFEKLHKSLAIFLPHYVKVDRLETEQLRDVDKQLNYLVARIKEAYTMAEGSATDYERTVASYQRELETQIKEEILQPLADLRKWKEVPSIKFIEASPETRLANARTLAVLGRQGLIVYDPELENYLRKQLGLPELDLNKLTEEEKQKRAEVQRSRR